MYLLNFLIYKVVKESRKLMKNINNKFYINAYIIASPVNTHYEYIKTILQKKKPLIIEKPMVKDVNELNKIKKLSKNINYQVLVNHSDLYNHAF